MMLLNKFKDKVEDYLKLVVYGRSKISVNLSELILGLKIVDTFNLAYLESHARGVPQPQGNSR